MICSVRRYSLSWLMEIPVTLASKISAGFVNRLICHSVAFRSNSVAYETPIAPTWLGLSR